MDYGKAALARSAGWGQQLATGGGAGQIGYQSAKLGAVSRTAQSKMSDTITVTDFGADPTGATDSTAAINAALAAVPSGGSVFFPAGTYLVQRGNGGAATDNIVASNVSIVGFGATITSRNAAGTITNDASGQQYNVFQATGRSNITIRDLAFSGYCVPVVLINCNNVACINLTDNGLLANPGNYLRDKALYFSNCTNVRVYGCYFNNANFAVYLGGTAGNLCDGVVVQGNNFQQTAPAGGFTALFPVGVYVYYATNVIVSGNSFADIFSSLSNGTGGTGMGYGVYEGDGACGILTVTGNAFHYTGKAQQCATAILSSVATNLTVTGNTVRGEILAQVAAGVHSYYGTTGKSAVITGNHVTLLHPTFNGRAIYTDIHIYTTTTAHLIDGNTINAGPGAIGVAVIGNATSAFKISNNKITGGNIGIQATGQLNTPLLFPQIIYNQVTGTQANAVACAGYVASPNVSFNTLLDGNLVNATGDSGAAVLLSSYAFGLTLIGNTIGNTPNGGGLFTFGVQNASDPTARIFKDIIANNNFMGLGDKNQLGRYWTSAPTNGIYDANKGDFIQNATIGAGAAPGWYVTQVLKPALAANASSASTTVQVSSTAGMLAGAVVLFTLDPNPYVMSGPTTYNMDFTLPANWWADTVASVTDGTHLVLTKGIPAGRTFVAGTATVTVARIKAAAAIAN